MKYRYLTHSFVSLRPALLALGLLGGFSAAALAGPDIKGFHSPSPIDDTTTATPFRNVTVTDAEGADLVVNIVVTPSGYGSFQPVSGLDPNLAYGTVQTSATNATTLLRSLVFVPQPNHIPVGTSQDVTFSVWATDTNGVSSLTNSSTVLTITPVNDPPTLGGVASTNTTDKASVSPFRAVSIADVDNDGTQQVSVTITQSDTNKGTLLLNGSGYTRNGATYSFTGTPTNALAGIRQLVFAPVENRIPVGQTETNTFVITVTDSGGASVSASNSVTVTSVNDAPVLTGLSSVRQAVVTGRTLTPFANALLTDPDVNSDTNRVGQSETITVTMSGAVGNGQLQASGSSGPVFTQSGLTPVDATTVLRSLLFAAQTFPLTTTNSITFTVVVTDDAGASVTNASVVVDVYTPYVSPALSGTRADQRVNDNSTIAPFSTVNVQSFNGGFFQVIVQLDSDAKGALINLGGFVKTGTPASYVFTGPSEDATTALRQMLFQPVNNRLNGATNERVVLSLTLVDGAVTNAPDASTSVIVTPVNDAPLIQGTSPLATITDADQRAPFPTVLLSDVDELGQQVLAVTVTLDDNSKGVFSAASLADSGFVNNSGRYTFTGTPTAASTAVRKLVFVPTAHRLPVGLSDITTFTINLNDNYGGLVASSATQVRVAAVNSAPVISVPASPISLPLAPPITPLASVSFSSPQTITVNVSVTNASWGTFTSASLAANGFTNTGAGSWSFTGSASNATAAIAGLEFVPDSHLPIGTTITYLISAQDPVGNIGRATLSLVLRQSQRSLIVTKLTDFDPADPSITVTQKNGTLRQAVLDAGNNDHITFDIRSAVAGVPDYPATIRLRAPLALNKNVTFDGPGAERLTISGDSNGDGTPDVQLFQANARVAFNRLTLAKGFHPTAGGAVEVSPGSSLTLRACAVVDCSAGVWGGGVDVNQGTLEVDHCLFRGNSTRAATGQGGGAISLYGTGTARIADSTFSGNQQLSPAGLGGGALYVENADPGAEFDVNVVCCTFAGNSDAAGHGSAIRPNVFNTTVLLQNSILADGKGKNLEMDESGSIVSLGGNISDDATATIFSIGGASYDTVILDQVSDAISTNPNLLPLANNGGPTWTYALGNLSPALGLAVSNAPSSPSFDALGTDQRGYVRDSAPDIGAFERQASARVIIEEILCAPAVPNNEFIEFYVPRDSTNLNLGNYQVWVGGVLRHTFASQNLRPGEALVLFSRDATNTGVPSGVYRQIAAGNLLLDNAADTITLKNPAGQVVLEVSYVNSFACSAPADPGYLTVANQSLVLSPQFQGVYLPYQRVVQKEGGRIPGAGELSGAGYDASGVPLALGNTPPMAYNDVVTTDSRTTLAAIPVLANDVDPDAADMLRVVAVGSNGVIGTNGLSAYQAALSINNSPRTGASIVYCPTNSAFLRSLPQGSNVVDTFQYVILDASNGVDHVRGSTDAEIAFNLAKATATVTVTVTGTNQAPTPADDSLQTYAGLTTREDAVLDFTTANTILANDTDPNSDDNSTTLNIVSVQATNGFANTTQTLSALGATVTLDIRYDRNQTHITYDPRGSAALNAIPAGQPLVDTFYYSVTDRYGAVGTAAVRITVTGVNDGPTANPDLAATDEDTPLVLPAATLLANDTDPDTGTVLQLSAVSPVSARGAAVSLTAGGVRYDPTVSAELNALARNEVLADSFTYTISDGAGGTSSTTVTVTVTGVNDAPLPANDLYATGEKLPLAVTAPGVLANDRDPDVNGVAPDDSLRVLPTVGQRTAMGARVSVNADGSFSYDPRGVFDWLAQGWSTNDTFTYTVMDHSLTLANNDLFTVRSGSSANVLPVLANDACLSAVGGVLSITGVGAPDQGGSVVVSNASTLLYTPPLNFSGIETFTYSVADGLGGSNTATVAITVTSATLNLNPDWFTVAKGSTVSLNVAANDSVMPAGTPLALIGVSQGNKGGSVNLSGSGAGAQLSYTPAATNTCPFTETFTYTASAAAGLQATGLVTVTVIDRSNSLTANDDNFTVASGGSVNELDVLANDAVLPATNPNLVITSIQTNGVMGTVSINATGKRLVYQPAPGVVQEPLVYYTISDGVGGTATANVLIRVQSSGLAGNDDVFSVMKNSTNNALPVLVNDAVFPAGTLTVTAIGIGANAPNHQGAVAINPAGTGLLYTPAPDFAGEETFTYEIGSGTADRGQGRVRVKVLDPAPVVSNPDVFAVARDSANNTLNVLSNDYVLPRTSGRLTITGVLTNGLRGTVTRNGTGPNNTLAYTPPAGFIGTDTLHYVVADELGNASTNLASVVVGALLARPDQFTVLSDSTQNALDVLANDLAFPDAGAVRPISAVGVPDHGGLLTTNADATRLLYTPAPGFVGTEQFAYQVADDSGRPVTGQAVVHVLRAGSDRTTATVTMTIIGTNDLPVIAGTHGSQLTDKQTVQPFTNVVISDVDANGLERQTVTVTLDDPVKGVLSSPGGFTNVAPGTYVMSGTPAQVTAALQALVFVPTENRIPVPTNEITRLTIAVQDGFVASPVVDAATTVEVTAVNDAPTIAGTQGGWRITDKQTVQPFANATIADVDNLGLQPLRVTVALDDAAKGTLQGAFTNVAAGRYAFGGTPADVTAALRALLFVPAENRIVVPTNENTRLTISVQDGFVANPVTDAATLVNVTAVNDAPTISGVTTSAITERETVQPFRTVTITEVDDSAAQSLRVVVTLDNAVKGSLQNLGGFVKTAPGTYALRGTGAAITAALRGLVYVPVQHRITVTTPEPATFTLAVDDGFAPVVTDSGTVVTVSAVNTPPAISGTVSNQRVYSHLTLRPFLSTLITEIDESNRQPLAVTVQLSSASHGYFTNLGSFVATAPGLYALQPATAAEATAALRGLIFVPTVDGRLGTNAFELTRMVLGVTDTGGASVQDANTTVLAYNGLVAKLSSSNGSATNAFACSVAATRDLLVAGAPTDNGNYFHSGSASLYARGTTLESWTLLKKLTSADSGTIFSQFEQFGAAVSIDGDVIAAGAPGAYQNNISSGVVYLFGRNQGGANVWGQLKKVLPSDGANSDLFGGAVAVYGDTLVVGARAHKAGTVKMGAAYVFERNQGGSNVWGLVKQLLPPDGADGDEFGVAVAIEQDTIAIGSQNHFAGKTGAVYLFERNQGGANAWGWSRTLSAADVSSSAAFGRALALRGGLLAVGAPQDSLKTGSAYLFARDAGGASQWGQLRKLIAPDGQTNDTFGCSVALDGGLVSVGAQRARGTTNAGAAYLFAQTWSGLPDWSLVEKMTPPQTDGCDNFGAAVALRQNTLVVGGRTVDSFNNQSVLAYIYRLKFGNAPYFVEPLSAFQLALNQPFEFTLPAGSVVDPDLGDTPVVTLGSALPSWLSFDAGRFSGTPSVSGVYSATLVATDVDGLTGSAQFTFTVVSLGDLVMALGRSDAGGVALQVAGAPGLTYALERAEALVGPTTVWTEIGTLTTDATGKGRFADTEGLPTAFYRLKLR